MMSKSVWQLALDAGWRQAEGVRRPAYDAVLAVLREAGFSTPEHGVVRAQVPGRWLISGDALAAWPALLATHACPPGTRFAVPDVVEVRGHTLSRTLVVVQARV